MGNKKIILVGGVIFIILLAGLITFGLLQSGAEKEVNVVTQEAKSLLGQGELEQALDVLQDGKKNKTLDEEGVQILTNVKKEAYEEFKKIATKAEKAREYQKAQEYYFKTYQLAQDPKEKEELKEDSEVMGDLATEQEQLQKELDAYATTFKEVTKNSNTLLSDFKKQVDDLQVQKITAPEFVEKMKQNVTISSRNIELLDEALYTINKQLLDLHRTVIGHVNAQHDMILQGLETTEENKKSLAEKFNSQFLRIKQDQVSLIQSLTNFAESNALTFDIGQN